ncbi:hypothetical protein [Flagellimonas marinaquae]|uniref:hypothetical protein n=1 Tax=Flagellimonas marinaquae TaxID=254955 RepID=UPI000F8E7B97|nr:hypothetical protein [Allomuricauda aquimarina]
MKKIIITSILLVTFFVLLGSINAISNMEQFNMISKTGTKVAVESVYSAKYDDCITEDDFPKGFGLYTLQLTDQHLSWDYKKVSETARKYGVSLDSTLKNLSTVDAHDFIHKTFLNSKKVVMSEDTSPIQKHYHYEIMRMCLERDKHLNQTAMGKL